MESSAGFDTAAVTGVVLVVLAIGAVIGLGLYIFACYCCKRICEKVGKEPGAIIWIPIANLVPLLEVAGMPIWMIILLLIPVVNIVVGVMMWARICEARGKSPWLVVLLLVPVANIIFLPYLAFSE
jgi:hypothetical protein